MPVMPASVEISTITESNGESPKTTIEVAVTLLKGTATIVDLRPVIFNWKSNQGPVSLHLKSAIIETTMLYYVYVKTDSKMPTGIYRGSDRTK